jgi:ornithine cyclodeaminase/alanine dehydrogenase-like protein (mu-crystallin family)
MGRSNLLPIGAGLNARWKQLYAAAILELDDAKLPDRITQARAAMRAKAADSLANLSDEERRALDDGFRVLRVLEGMTTKRNPAA